MITIYGIPQCDSVRKTQKWLTAHHIASMLIDVREHPPSQEQLSTWWQQFGDHLVNKRSTTFRAHKPEVLSALQQGESAVIALLQTHPTLIKRPVIVIDQSPKMLGWNESKLAELVK